MNIKMIIQMVGLGCLLSCNKLEQIADLEFLAEDSSSQLPITDHKENNFEDLNDNNSQWQEILNDDTASDKSKQIARDQIQKNNARIDEINDKINNLQEAKTKLEE